MNRLSRQSRKKKVCTECHLLAHAPVYGVPSARSCARLWSAMCSLMRSLFWAYPLRLTERRTDAMNLKTWLDSKKPKGKKKKPLFDLRSYSLKTGETNVHTLKLGGMRHPYDLQVTASSYIHACTIILAIFLLFCVFVFVCRYRVCNLFLRRGWGRGGKKQAEKNGRPLSTPPHFRCLRTAIKRIN